MPRAKPLVIPSRVHARLRALVDADGRSVAAIAEAGGMSAEVLRQILRGQRPNPTVNTVGSILIALGKTWADLD